MLVLSVNVGQAVQIADAAVIRIENKRADSVRMIFATDLYPIRLIKDGVIPERFTRGITGKPRAI